MVSAHARGWQSVTDAAVFEIAGTSRLTKDEMPSGEKIKIKRDEIVNEIRNGNRELTVSFLESPEASHVNIASDFHHLLEVNEDAIPAAEAFFASLIMGARTAFETLAADLWVACLNANPLLGFVALGAEITADDDEQERDRKYKTKYPLNLHLLKDCDFNLKKSMGTVLRKKWDFARREKAVEAYHKVFDDASKPNPFLISPKETIDGIFWNTNMSWLIALRNALIHSGGKVDSEFKNSVANHPILKACEVGEPIPLDGQLISPLIEQASKCGQELIEFVSKWLKAYDLRNAKLNS